MEILVAGLMLVLILAYANGANDVSKAVATLVGSGVTNYHTALLWGTIWTMLEATLGRWSGYCLCLQPRSGTLIAVNPQGESRILYQATGADVVVDRPTVCERSQLSGLTVGMDSIHWLSSGAASFARGLNDAP